MNRLLALVMILGLAGGLLHAKRTFFPSQAQQAAALMADPVPPIPPEQVRGPAVDVYGVAGCGFTRRMLADLQLAGVPVRYYDLDKPAVETRFNDRFRHAGVLRAGVYELPIVEVAGKALARPSSDSIIDRFRTR